ncbi:hypothetical protein CLAFUW4_09908 [Fulvia fulva]|uniref:Uncharacterized protein n=1 Tax=Passalora fulva TaxID=5499 RepID=A0A9Q8PIM8_PASFU|nr:uncharacterized protein CLAFUR5_12332 [Fulvia fulva]KAK4615460.1 hypothetical protein CLAFUR4_09913 [Fulvia fulva]KAK4617261.1 hypothetical protein CLAFUR0_09907 [Fulvia fulva]UJO23173.1 hypothetical protein CLAFUR5_12332 [Fulvia fulva]WPV18977.1 hypothetical protein CLAFUW4_09908 [Fulvia fulva]WPV33764.1 hypothetical protein CLAFUW7_09910 [Fulvia fulva]
MLRVLDGHGVVFRAGFDGGYVNPGDRVREVEGRVAAQGADFEDALGAEEMAEDGELGALGGGDGDSGEAGGG